jgi:hypothetical protein
MRKEIHEGHRRIFLSPLFFAKPMRLASPEVEVLETFDLDGDPSQSWLIIPIRNQGNSSPNGFKGTRRQPYRFGRMTDS